MTEAKASKRAVELGADAELYAPTIRQSAQSAGRRQSLCNSGRD